MILLFHETLSFPPQLPALSSVGWGRAGGLPAVELTSGEARFPLSVRGTPPNTLAISLMIWLIYWYCSTRFCCSYWAWPPPLLWPFSQLALLCIATRRFARMQMQADKEWGLPHSEELSSSDQHRLMLKLWGSGPTVWGGQGSPHKPL